MKYFYVQATKGFYTFDIHGNAIPEDAVEITEEYYKELLEGNSNGQVISVNDNGYPILIGERYTLPKPTDEQLGTA
jgi:hypothetical protein